MLIHILNSVLFGILLGDLIERRFPKISQQLYDITLELAHNAIYLYSKAQIVTTQLVNKCNHYIDTNEVLKNIKCNLYSFIDCNKMDDKIEFISEYGEITNEYNYNFIIYSYVGENGHVNKKITQTIAIPENKPEETDIKFILIEIIIAGRKYVVNLKTDNYNYYLVGNRFNRAFFDYYLKYHLNVTDDFNEEGMIVKIIDHEINSHEYDFSYPDVFLVLSKQDYDFTCERAHINKNRSLSNEYETVN